MYNHFRTKTKCHGDAPEEIEADSSEDEEQKECNSFVAVDDTSQQSISYRTDAVTASEAHQQVSLSRTPGRHFSATPVDDLPLRRGPQLMEEKCFICKKRALTGCIVHGSYCHICTCYKCAIALQSKGEPCIICGRDIETVLTRLPLSVASRQRLKKQYQSHSAP